MFSDVLEEAGVYYTRDADLACYHNMRLYYYQGWHLSHDRRFSGAVFCRNELDFYKLVNHWNKADNDWKYWV